MLKSKHLLSIIAASLIMIFMLTGCGNTNTPTQPTTPAAPEPIVLKFGHINNDNHPIHAAALKMAEIVKTKTNDRYVIEVFPGGALGNERDMIEGVKMGSLDLCYTAGTPLGNYVPEMLVTDLPFLIKDCAHADKVYHGEIGDSLLAAVDKKGFKALTFVEIGFRNVALTKKAITKVEDFKGLKIRTMENKLHLESWRTLGANPLPMAWGDAFTALQQGAIDAVEVTNTHMTTLGVVDVMKYYAETHHVYTPGLILVSKNIWDGLSKDDQKIFMEAANEARLLNDKLYREVDAKDKETIKNKGVEMHTIDQAQLIEAVKAVYSAHPEFNELVNKIQNIK